VPAHSESALAAYGRYLYDVAAVLLDHMRQHIATAQIGPLELGVDNIVPGLFVHLRNGDHGRVSGVFDQNIDFTELLSISDDLARSFYEKQCEKESWSVRELKRQRNSGLFERLALSKDKKGVLELARSRQVIETGKDLVKNPYVFEFLNIAQDHRYTEKE
jgi:hypothetical protein